MAKDTKVSGKAIDPEGHGDNTAPSTIQSPATFAPLSQTPDSANQKTSDLGKKGSQITTK